MTKTDSRIIKAGAWPPDAGQEKQPLEWIMLECRNSVALLLCTKSVAVMPYHNSYAFISWEKSDVRKWLNGVFFEKAFSREEKERIVRSEVKYDSYKHSGSISEEITDDNVFLLNSDEAYRYFGNDAQRQAVMIVSGTEKETKENRRCWWWLRSVGYYVNSAAVVYKDGGISSCGVHIGLSGGVRPAIRMRT